MNYPDLILRPAQPDEAGSLSALALRSKAYWGYSAAQIELWREELAITAQTFTQARIVVASHADRVLGFYVLNLHPEVSRLEHLWVDPAAIGQGVGKRLFQDASLHLQHSGLPFMEIEADPNALGFYQAQGARHIGDEPAPIAGEPGRTLPQLRWYANRPH